jgi:hypothetical protein
VAKWHLAQSDSALASGSTTKTLVLCSYKESPIFSYRQSRTSCPNRYRSTLYTRSTALPAKPIITQVTSTSYESASLALASDPAANLDAPIVYYTITSSKGDVKKVNSWRELTVTVSGLKSATSYTFTITATSVDGTSPVSASSLPVTTQVYVAPVAAVTSTPLAAPAFTLSASAETRTVSTAATGFTISASTGGTIASFGISATPAGMSFSTSTGALSGTPTSIAAATTYTVTANNASGSATRTFTLTITGVVYTVGQTGPGGGKVFYVADIPFTCGPTLNLTCSYLEAAPTTGTSSWSDTSLLYTWSGITGTVIGTTSTGVGSGYKNTLAIIGQSSTSSKAGTISQAYRGPNNLTDWHLPSQDELNQMCKWARGVAWISDATLCAGGAINSPTYGADTSGFASDYYWSSSEYDASDAWYQFIGNTYTSMGRTTLAGDQQHYPKFLQLFVRPIRAF